MPHNHSIGTSQAESSVRYIRRLMRMAFAYAKTNKALKHLGFTEIDIERCWGEIFYWSIVLLLIRPAWHDSTITRYEAATGRRFNIQTIRLLPIFSCLLVWHENSNQYVHGIYVGPAWNGIMSEPTPGAIRVLYKAGTGVQIVVTQQYKCVTRFAKPVLLRIPYCLCTL